ncbi:MAG: MFS transporter [Mycobacterium pseudokansasii]|uniref:Multidrug resistance protein MdtG n=1 Tax=Mycobacterium pseudokansasii TaxID=2341080 RepID=A0A498R1T7_9MYCO|nr:MFS transporter [Mycobacterium pseudokansasii]KZS68044.1 MFS transporter [Mycobacterium kansasii]MBY0391143.1 MFS transporter [Mycobacterium pseudokansasii]VAZ99777.1 Multidrug resistance protein MdtG [Mycobacterium pseudokansasii]VBA30992.1 Multidrug resistance protein MdtG [Mycobacterium pseudokansasii]VBA53858.1 Multidrug resistance protein MdtG [Mycobacterium pseudokansasii]
MTRARADERWLTPGVGAVGAASFFSDSGHEITTALLPTFLTSTLHGSAAALGVIDGFSDALVGVMQLVGGPLANDPSKRTRTASGGYLGTAVATGSVGLAATVWQAGVLRALAWVSRGLRSPSRDALLASITPTAAHGRAFGLERAGDNLGAVAGPLLAAGLVAWVGVRPALLLAAIPGLFAAIAIFLAASECRRRTRPTGEVARRRLDLAAVRNAGMLRALAPVALFEFGNVATTLLILRATQLLTTPHRPITAATSLAILIYASHNVIATLASLVAGRWYDRAGPRVVFAAGAAVYVVGYGVFAAGGNSVWLLLVAFGAAGAGIGLAEPTESAVVAQLLPDRLRGTGFGLLGVVKASGDVVATVVAGVLYTVVSPVAAFGYAAAWMLVAVLASGMLRPPANQFGSEPT